jgi:hypothetical protein
VKRTEWRPAIRRAKAFLAETPTGPDIAPAVAATPRAVVLATFNSWRWRGV